MARWLLKTEPETYSLADLQRDQQTCWDGVANPQAQKFMRAMQRGDDVLIYHTGKVKAVVGAAVVTAPALGDDVALVEIAYRSTYTKPLLLTTLKQHPALATWALVRQPRLSVMPIPDTVWQIIHPLLG